VGGARAGIQARSVQLEISEQRKQMRFHLTTSSNTKVSNLCPGGPLSGRVQLQHTCLEVYSMSKTLIGCRCV